MQISRLFEIVYLLLDKKKITADELARRFEVSKRTILRDIDALAEAGIPIYTMRGKGGGIAIMDNYVLDKTVISSEEQAQILFALQSMSVTGHIDTENILSRLRRLFEKQYTDWIEVDLSRWGDGYTDTDKARFETLRESIISERVVTFSYSSSFGKISDRRVYPLKLIFKSRAWYLQSFCLDKNDYRLFKISRMRHVKIMEDVFDSKAFQAPKADPISYSPSSSVKITLKFSPQAAHRVYDDFDEQFVIENTDGSLTASMTLPREWACDYVLSFGVHVEVIEPQSVRDEMMDRLNKIKNIYLRT